MTSDPGPPQQYPVQFRFCCWPYHTCIFLFSLYIAYCLLFSISRKKRHQVFLLCKFCCFSATQLLGHLWTLIVFLGYFCPHGFCWIFFVIFVLLKNIFFLIWTFYISIRCVISIIWREIIWFHYIFCHSVLTVSTCCVEIFSHRNTIFFLSYKCIISRFSRTTFGIFWLCSNFVSRVSVNMWVIPFHTW